MHGADEEPRHSWQSLGTSDEKTGLLTTLSETKYDRMWHSQAGEVWDIK